VFREANSIARQFTWPVVISTKPMAGACTAGIGTCVIINDEGWIVTAHHIVEMWQNLFNAHTQVRDAQAKRAQIENDATLSNTQRHKALNKTGNIHKDAPDQISMWFGSPVVPKAPIKVVDGKFFSIPAIDIAVAKLEDFDPAWVKAYPTLKIRRRTTSLAKAFANSDFRCIKSRLTGILIRECLNYQRLASPCHFSPLKEF
jgi:hypothetical protein